jgi:hypothetical protein
MSSYTENTSRIPVQFNFHVLPMALLNIEKAAEQSGESAIKECVRTTGFE